MTELIKKILREELTSNQQKLRDLSDSVGINQAANFVGGIKNYVNIMYGGDLKKYAENEGIQLVRFNGDGTNLILDDLLVQLLNLKDVNSKEKELGKFSFGNQNGLRYSFNARLLKLTNTYGLPISWRVVGMSGDSGFGYGFLTQRNTLGKRYRQQIFKQIIEKIQLGEFMI